MTEEQKQIVEDNLNLVHYIAKRYENASNFLTYEDIFQAGCEGLIHAVMHYDESSGYKFSTYACPCIEGRIQRELDGKDNLIAIPYQIGRDLQKWKKSKSEETLEEFANKSHHKKEYVLAAYNALLPVVYLEQPLMGEEEWNSLKDFIVDEKAEFEKWVAYRTVCNIVHNLLDDLPNLGFTEKQVEVLKKRYGFEGDPMTLDEIGTYYGISRERVRQIEAKALRKLRSLHSIKMDLNSCLEMCCEHDFSDYV